MNPPTAPEVRHTPTPWTLLGGMIGEAYKIQAHSEHHEIVTPCRALKNADAEFIVRAVNCHEELLAALKGISDGIADGWCVLGQGGSSMKIAIDRALAKAEGK